MRLLPIRRYRLAGVCVMTMFVMAGCGYHAAPTPTPAPAPVPAPPQASSAVDTQDPSSALIGKPAPAFATVTTTGKRISLQSLRGKVVLLDYWATWCVPCKMAMPTLESLHRKFAGKGLVVLGLSMDDPSTIARVAPVARQLKVTYAIAASPQDNSQAAKAYQVTGYPSQYLIDKKGQVRWTQPGFSFSEKSELSALIQKLLAEPA